MPITSGQQEKHIELISNVNDSIFEYQGKNVRVKYC